MIKIKDILCKPNKNDCNWELQLFAITQSSIKIKYIKNKSNLKNFILMKK